MKWTRWGLVIAGLAVLVACGRVPVSRGRTGPVTTSEANTISFEVPQENIPSLRPSADRGRDLYAQNCQRCHGADGRPSDAQAPDFSRDDWLRHSYPPDQREFLAHGQIPATDVRQAGRVHNYGASLPLQAQWDVLSYCWYLSSGGADELRQTSTLVFGTNCNVCHGNKGFGNGFLAPTMEPVPRNLSDYERWGMLRTNQEIYDNIYYGVHWSAMPPWRGVLGEQDLWKLVHFIRALQYDLPESASPSSGDKGEQNAG